MEKYFFKGTHEEIASQNEQLRQEVAQTEKYKSVSTLASGLAHEIKNPLTTIKTFAEYLPQKLHDREFINRFSSLVGREVERINGLVHQLIDYSKPASPRVATIPIHGLLEETIDMFGSQALKHNIKIVKEYAAPQDQKLPVDRPGLKQALVNIILNAIEAMPEGGVLTVKTARDKTWFVITVSDTGEGIIEEDLPRIFDPFYTRKDHGTGLGLSITLNIIENHKGKIRIQNGKNGGTEVTIKLPVKE